MMEGLELFRKLGAGAKFNFKRFRSDAERLKIIQPKQKQEGESGKSVLDFFNTLSREGATVHNGPAKQSPSEKIKEDDTSSIDKSDLSEDDEGSVRLLQAGCHGDRDGPRRKKRKKEKRTVQKLAQMKREQMSHLRRQHHIHVHGSDIPDPVSSFQQLMEEYHVHPQLMRNVAALGFDAPTPIQMQAIPGMLQGRELLACAPTGSGKTAAFILPILHTLKQPQNCGFRALVLSPTRELAKQTQREFCHLAEGRGFRIHIIEKSKTAAKKFGPNSSKKFDILVSTPSRLVYLLKQEPPLISLSKLVLST
ncbi:putative ATP-dependent RNA helicase DDX52 [Lamellibrachia satsuma]|nr:putative ATP-dependent RNA helicase DDX52 [Lamellibrachia satsuma]